MPKLYSYCIPYDDGAAPNPFGGICTLVICKPVIRRSAEVGDWIVATGCTRFGFQNKVVYAMEVTKKMTMAGYDDYCKVELSAKIPSEGNYRNRVGDCIYDFSTYPPRIRGKVHNEDNIKTDLGGKNALISEHFYYFGEKPVDLPNHLLPIVKQGQGHKSNSITDYLQPFIKWIITEHKAARNKVVNEPFLRNLFTEEGDYVSKCAERNRKLDEEDEALDNEEKLYCKPLC